MFYYLYCMCHFQMPKQKVYLFLENLALLIYGFYAIKSSFDKYLVQLIVLLKPDFNCVNYYALSWFDKITTGR